ncbi:MAG: hypothetical protein RPT95_13665 [Candidatus Sedimenticola sp. (ex Thyasira tokunagai)]
MWLSADDRLRLHPALRDIANWPMIELNQIRKDKRKAFLRNRKAMALILIQQPYEVIHRETGIHPSQLSRLKKRALEADENSPPPLSEALIPGRFLFPSKRRQSLSTLTESKGDRCSFEYLLQTVPRLRENLDEHLWQDIDEDPDAQNLNPGAFHAQFLESLESANHRKDTYPYTTERVAYESCRKYYHRRRAELLAEYLVDHSPNRIIQPYQPGFYYGREIQIDEYTYDGPLTIFVKWQNDYVPLRVSRVLLVVIADVDTTAVLGFSIAYMQHHCSQYDVLATMITATQFCDMPEPTVEGIVYQPGHAFPNNISEEIARVAWDEVSLDNALEHCAESVSEHIGDIHSGTIHLGIPGAPKSRNTIEYVINKISQQAKRQKSTSGKHPADPIRESRKNSKKPPALTDQAMLESVFALLSYENNAQKPHLMGKTPLDAVKQSLATHPHRLLPQGIHRESPFILRKKVTVKWLSHERRKPHINFAYHRYTGDCLIQAIDKAVWIEYDFRDIRKLKVITENGEELSESSIS